MLSHIKTVAMLLVVSGFAFQVKPGQAAAIDLFEFGINLDGTTSCGGGPGVGGFCDTGSLANLSGVPGVDDSAFDFSTGLGTIEVTVSSVGMHTVDLFLDHEIDEAINTFFNEFGATSGAPSPGQSWEIDEPGLSFGDIRLNFVASTLDNTNGVPASSDEDVSMAQGWDFVLGAGETATIGFLVSELAPSGFFLAHADPDSNATIYFSSTIDIVRTPIVVPEPSTLALLGLGLAGLGFARRRRL